MCVKEFLGFNCGHCALPTLRACPLASQSPHFPYCRYPAERAIPVPENCPPCARVVWNQRTLANEEAHREMHRRLGREDCVFEGERGRCETRFDVDVERERGGGERWNAEVGGKRTAVIGELERERQREKTEGMECGIGMVRHKVPKKERKKRNREIDETIARVEARFAAVTAGTGRRVTIESVGEDGWSDCNQRQDAAPGFPRSILKLQTEEVVGEVERCEEGENECFGYQTDGHLNTSDGSDLGLSSSGGGLSSCIERENSTIKVYVGYQLHGETVKAAGSPIKVRFDNVKEERDWCYQTRTAGPPDVPDDFVQKNIGTGKYYPGKGQYEGAAWDDMIVNAKHNKPARAAVPTGPRSERDRSIQFGSMTPQKAPQKLPLGWSVPPGKPPGTNASGSTDAHIAHVNLLNHQSCHAIEHSHCSQSVSSGCVEAPESQFEAHVSQKIGFMAVDQAIFPEQFGHPVQEDENEHSYQNRQYQGPVIVSSDMANPEQNSAHKS